MKGKLKDKKHILKKLSIFLSLILFCIVVYSISSYTSKQEFKSKNLLAGDASSDSSLSGIDINSIELNASLRKITNTTKLDALKGEDGMKGKTDDEIIEVAIQRGIIKQEDLEDIEQNRHINTSLDFTKVDVSKFSPDYSATNSLSLINLLDKWNLSNSKDTAETKRLINVGIIGDKIKTEYDIKLNNNPISNKDVGEVPKDVVIIIDTKLDANIASNLSNGFNNEILTNKFVGGNNNLNFKMISFHRANNGSGTGWGEYHTKNNSADTDWEDYYFGYTGMTHNNYLEERQNLIKMFFNNCKPENVDTKDEMNNALQKADTWFKSQDKTRVTQSAKTIIIVSKEISDSERSNCQITNNYNIITLFAGGNNNGIDYNFGYGSTLEELSKSGKSNVRNLHGALGGGDSNFFVSYGEDTNQNGNDNQTHNDVESTFFSATGKKISERIAINLSNSEFNYYVNIQGVLHFNLGKDIDISSDVESNKNVISGINADGEHTCDITVPQIKLKTDYEILGKYNLVVSNEFMDDLILNTINNTKPSGIEVKQVKLFLQRRLKELGITISDNDTDIDNILKNIYDEKLNVTIDTLNSLYESVFYTTDPKKCILSKEIYNLIKDTKAIDVLKNNINIPGYKKEDYSKLTNILMEIMRDGMQEKLNNALSEKILAKYSTVPKEKYKNDIIDGILANTTEGDNKAKEAIKNITGKSSTETVGKILTTIKSRFRFDTGVSALNLSSSTKADLKSKGIITINTALNNTNITVSEEIRAEIRFLLKQMLNQPLNLTKTTFIVVGSGKTVGFTIEPTVRAALDEGKSSLRFKTNPEGSNYIQFNSTGSSGNVVTNGTPIKFTPVLDIKRILVNKNHLVYGKLYDATTNDDRDIVEATKMDGNGSIVFADKSVVTFAANVNSMSGPKNISLNLNIKDDQIRETGKENVVQEPRIYRVNGKKLEYICGMVKDTTESGTLKYVTQESINGDIYKDVIILYSVKLDGSSVYKNSVNISGLSGGTGDIIITAGVDLPDLF